LLVGGGVGFAIVSAFLGQERLARLAPAETALWVESQDIKSSWEAFKQSEAWAEFEASKTYEEASKGWGELVKVSESGDMQLLTDLGLSLNERTVLHFLGKDVAFGALAPADADPSLVAMVQIDVAGVIEDVALQGDWTALWDKMQSALGGEGAQKETYKDYDVLTRTAGGVEAHFALLEDVLVLSHSKPTVQAVIDVKVGERPSLADQAAFGREVGRLSKDEVAYTYIDMGFVRDAERVKQTVHRLGALAGAGQEAEQFTGEELKVLIDDLKPIEGLALAATIPDGDVYQLDVVASRDGDDMFKENERNDLRELVSEETMLYLEAHGFYDLVVGSVSSPAMKALTETEAFQWLAKKLENPQQLADLVPEAGKVGTDKNPAFELKVFWALLKLELREILGNDLALVIETRDAEEPTDAVRPLVFLRSRPLLRVLTDLASGAMAAHTDKNEAFSVGNYGERQVFSVSEGPMAVYWTRIGQDLVISGQKDMVETVIDRAAGKDAGAVVQSEALAKTITKLPDDYKGFVYFDQGRYQNLLAHAMPPGEAEQLDKLLAASKGMEAMAFGFYVSDDYATTTFRSYHPFGEGMDEALKGAYKNADPHPVAWDRLPAETFGSMTLELDPESVYAYLLKIGKSVLGDEQFSEMLAEVEAEVLGGKKLSSDVIAHLGQSHGAGLVRQPKLPLEGAESNPELVAVPAGAAVMQLKDAEAFKAVFKGLVEKGLEVANAQRAGGHGNLIIGQLYTLSTAQSLFREGDKELDEEFDYGTLDELAQTDLVDPALGSGRAYGYQFEVYVSKEAPQFLWIASARPVDFKAGDHTYLINQSGMVYYTDQAVVLDDTCEPPEGALPYGGDAPAPRQAGAQEGASKDEFTLAKTELGGVEAYRLTFPASDTDVMKQMVGRGFGPCFAFVEGQLLVATSEPVLVAMIEGDDPLVDADDFERAWDDFPGEVAASYHLSLAGLLEQVSANAETIARKGAPAPADMKAPTYPEFPEVSGEEFEAAYAEYEKEVQAYEQEIDAYSGKLDAWREEHAEENAKELARLLDSLDVLGDVFGYSVLDDDDGGIESAFGYRMNLD
jgi:hypothetical protein